MDWKNREYVAGLVRLKDGRGELHEYSEEFGGMHDTTLWELQTVAFGDVDGDGLDEALVLIQETYYAPSGPGSERLNVYLYRELAGDVVQLGETLSVSKSASAGIERGYIMLSEPEGCTVYRLQANIWTRQTDGCPLK